MPDNSGLLMGLAQGVQSGIGAYQNQQELERRKQQTQQQGLLGQAQLQNMGFQQGPQGGLVPTPIRQAQLKQQQDTYDPNSELSQRTRQSYKGLLSKAGEGLEEAIPDNMSAAELHESAQNGLIGKAISGAFGMQGRYMSNQRMQERNDIARQGLDLRSDAQASTAADKIHNDSQVKSLTQQLQLTERGRALLDKPGMTNQEFNDVQQEISNAIAGAKGSALGKLERTEYDSAQQQLASLVQKISGKPQDAVPPEILNRVKSLADDLVNTYKKNRSDRAQNLGRDFPHNQNAKQAMEKAINTYKYNPVSEGKKPGSAKDLESMSADELKAYINGQ